jgi:flavin-dependent dehydrogenase
MSTEGTEPYDCAIVGGGVAGLALSILLARSKVKVILFEKESYPFNKVCGEYISAESLPFIKQLGLNLPEFSSQKITSLFLSSPSGIKIKRPLDAGGFGISRYRLDYLLYNLALTNGVEIMTDTKVQSVNYQNDVFQLNLKDIYILAKTVCGAYGKNSNLDVKLKRTIKTNEKDLFIGVKYHVKIPFDTSQVEMHNFIGGYCGVSAIENKRVNLSYITNIKNLRKYGNSIKEMEKQHLSVNPFLKKYFQEAEFENEKPLVISHLKFSIKTPVDNHILMLGDAAGNIAPLSGNGMSMAFRSALIAYNATSNYLSGKLSRGDMEKMYSEDYTGAFSSRIRFARIVQSMFAKPIFTDLSFYFLCLFPGLIDYMQTKIRGKEF